MRLRSKKGIIILIILLAFAPGLAISGGSLHKAAYDGDIDRVRTLLTREINPDERDNFGGTALHAAMFQKNLDIIELLIEAGLDINARGSSNGYTPLHDAVWAGNLEGARLLVSHGARTDIRGRDGLTPYEKAVKENKKELAAFLEHPPSLTRTYSAGARESYSENDVKAFVYKWFAGFDHQAEPEYFTAHLDPEQVDMAFPDFPIRSLPDFLKWYQGIVETIQWNSHQLSGLEVTGSEEKGFSVSLNVRWQAKTYDHQTYDLNVHQDWEVTVASDRRFLISRHRAGLIQ